MAYRDTTGRTLDDYPRPSVAVDTAVLTVTADARLTVVLVRPDSTSAWRLPGTFLHPRERLADAVRRSLHDKCGIVDVSPAQLHVFDDPARDDRGWVLSVAHLAAVPVSALHLTPGRAGLVPVDEVAALPYDHDAIVAAAATELRARYAEHPDPAGLLGEPFTVRDLRALHEAVAGRTLPRDTFRRTMIGQLTATGTMQTGAVGKPAELYRHRAGR